MKGQGHWTVLHAEDLVRRLVAQFIGEHRPDAWYHQHAKKFSGVVDLAAENHPASSVEHKIHDQVAWSVFFAFVDMVRRPRGVIKDGEVPQMVFHRRKAERDV